MIKLSSSLLHYSDGVFMAILGSLHGMDEWLELGWVWFGRSASERASGIL